MESPFGSGVGPGGTSGQVEAEPAPVPSEVEGASDPVEPGPVADREPAAGSPEEVPAVAAVDVAAPANAATPSVATEAAAGPSQLASLDQLAQQFEQLGRSWSMAETIALSTATGTSVIFSAGYLLWAVRGGSLVTSVLCAIPAWRLLDPIPVLEFERRKTRRWKRDKDAAADSDTGPEMLFE